MELIDDLLVEILSKLPFKPLFRFNCVSKGWHALISGDPHVRRNLPLIMSGVFSDCNPSTGTRIKYAYFCQYAGLQECTLDFFPRPPSSGSTVVDYSNGLMLLSTRTSPRFYVCDPITKRWEALPVPEEHRPSKPSLLSVLAYDPWSCSTRYKVVCFMEWKPQGAVMMVFSSGSRRWSEHCLEWGVSTDTLRPLMHYFDGVLHILCLHHEMMSIHLDTMECRRSQLPQCTAAHHGQGLFRGNGGKLHYTANDGSLQRFWTLEDGGQWVQHHSIAVGDIRGPSKDRGRVGFDFLAYHPERETVYFWVAPCLLSYDFRRKRVEEVCELSNGCYPLKISLSRFSDPLLDSLIYHKDSDG